MHTFKKVLGAGGVLYFLPLFAFAQVTADTLMTQIAGLLNAIIPLIIGLAFLYFLWGVYTYVVRSASEEDKEKSRNTIIYGVIGLFVMLAAWGLVNVLINTFELETDIGGSLPTITP